MSDNAEKKEEGDAQQIEAGTVMQCGATDYWAIGRTKDVRIEYPSLQVPTRLKALEVSFHYLVFWKNITTGFCLEGLITVEYFNFYSLSLFPSSQI
jgi:hypothetical protein